MRAFLRLLCAGLLAAGGAVSAVAAAGFPLSLVAEVTAKSASTTVTSKVTIKVDRPIEESRRKRVLDALQYSGYQNSLNVLRGLPAIGTITVESRSVNVKFAHETTSDAGRHLVLVADRPLFFLSAQPDKSRAGYELTVVELTFDKDGHATGTMSGAARVKPAGDGNVAMSDFADTPMQAVVR